MSELTEKQKRFADYYVETTNATESAIRAGYSAKSAARTGSENLHKPYIKEYIAKRLKQLESKRIASAEEVLQYLTRVVRGTETEEVVVVEGVGDGRSEATKVDKTLSAKDRIKAAELLGKRYMLFTDKQQVEIAVPTIISGDDELAE